jgi:hypothetical protein
MCGTSMFRKMAPACVNEVRNVREQLHELIEVAIALLDALDGDADFEAETGVDQDFNPITLNPERRMPTRRATIRRQV